MPDLVLAVAHHLLVFGLVVMLAMELALVRLERPDVAALARLDAAYGLTALLIIVVGVCRVIWGGKGWAFYQDNVFFWMKMGAFAAIGLVSIGPTLLFMRWSRATKADGGFAPPPDELKRARAWLWTEVGLILPLVALAAAMARWPL